MSCHKWFLPIIAALWLAPVLSAGAIEVSPAGTRTPFTNIEPIELALSGGAATSMVVRHSDGSTLTIQVPAAATSRLVTIKPGVLKPGRYSAGAGSGVEWSCSSMKANVSLIGTRTQFHE